MWIVKIEVVQLSFHYIEEIYGTCLTIHYTD